jgi:hypothetical protein
MMRRRIYTDTSVVGGCLDEEFKQDSLALFAAFNSGASILVLSSLTLAELEQAPDAVKDIIKTIPTAFVEYIAFDEEAQQLAEAYLQEKVVSEKSRVDAQHIATATINNVGVLVSWNFKHIVNLDRIHGYNSVNVKLGYSMLEIRTPKEVLKYDN